jgi:16S rRNA (uracil1498-N3)-methyltransferase
MDRGNFLPLRALPRVFLPGLDVDEESYELPKEEVDKFRKVLRLKEGYQIGVLPGDGTLIRCEFRSLRAWPIAVERPGTEPEREVTLIQALPKGDRLDTVIRMGTELGVSRFVLFPAERSVVRWEEGKLKDKIRRYNALIREAAEQSYRTKLPSLETLSSLKEVLTKFPEALVFSEQENVSRRLPSGKDTVYLVVGPEGGWAPREIELIGERALTLGKLVLRTDTAGVVAAALALLSE